MAIHRALDIQTPKLRSFDDWPPKHIPKTTISGGIWLLIGRVLTFLGTKTYCSFVVEPTPFEKYAQVKIGSFPQGSGFSKKSFEIHHLSKVVPLPVACKWGLPSGKLT